MEVYDSSSNHTHIRVSNDYIFFLVVNSSYFLVCAEGFLHFSFLSF